MKLRFIIFYVLLINAGAVFSQDVFSGRKFVRPDTSLKNSGVNKQGLTELDSSMLDVITRVNHTYNIADLADIIDFCAIYCNRSDTISLALTTWLRENHDLYTNKSPTESNQFRGFLINSLSKFKPNDLLYHYVKYELQFGEYAFNIAAAAHTARNFELRARELIRLFKPYLNTAFRDEFVDITTPFLKSPLLNPTKVRYEILETLMHFGSESYGALKMIDELNNYLASNAAYEDSVLLAKCAFASRWINEATPVCCRKELEADSGEKYTSLTSKKERQTIAGDIKFIDQQGNPLQFKDLKGKPFVLAFFYTRCANPLKCVSTVARLAQLQNELTNQNRINKVGIYAMTFDPDFDKPSLLKGFGEVYGIKFTKNVRFLLAADESGKEFTSQLQLRVNYGFGSVNLHGTQLYVFDKKGKLALISDNENWTVNQVANYLNQLVEE